MLFGSAYREPVLPADNVTGNVAVFGTAKLTDTQAINRHYDTFKSN